MVSKVSTAKESVAKAKERRWVLAPELKLKKDVGFLAPIIQVLFNRGIIEGKDLKNLKKLKELVSNFLEPDYEINLNDPYLLPDMEKAVERIIKALEEKEKIAIYGDYDVDGITATALLSNIFTKLRANFIAYIPERGNEGYGLNIKAIDSLKKKDAKLIITVDCGILSFGEADYVKKQGIDLIITDHHEVRKSESKDVLPNCLAAINPKRTDSKYPFNELSGVGIAFKLASALLIELDKKKKLSEFGITREWSKWLLDLVALGTICDIVPLKGENRVLAFYGIKVLRKTRRIGLRFLASSASLDLTKITSHNIGFHLGPRLNASGRLEHANSSLRLLITENPSEAKELAKKLSDLNAKRQLLTQKILEEAKLELKGKEKDKLVFLKNKNWPAGVLGIVASRLVDECGKPVLILEEGIKESKGSARSIKNFSIIDALTKCEEFLITYGGHKKAAGVSVKNEHFIILNEKLLKIADKEIREEDLIPEIIIDSKLELDETDDNLYLYVEKMEPFGYGNQVPIFLLENLKISVLNKVGKEGNHLKLAFESDGKSINGILFNASPDLNLEVGDLVDSVCHLSQNEWLGIKKVELKIIEIKKKN
ncbi:MAG: single-stranded-DNA-specific exonuclease RecJ [Patescibacteria group bacterium]|nr:single-stranded-DNA-specific exonuclease RecJ [Patescibacteria group bacterium]MCL5093619.1 single-stranded-DNA-specific exonuclease RecJ [Patescibacteria group bacterium]